VVHCARITHAMSSPKNDAFFNQCFRSLVRYREDRGTFDVPNSYEDAKGRKLGAWLYRIRRAYADGKLAQDRIDRFLEIGYDFEEHRISSAPIKTPPKKAPPPPSASSAKKAKAAAVPSSSKSSKKKDKNSSTHRARVDTWDKNFDRLVKFKEEHGHLVPNYNTHKALRMWVNKQQELWYYGDLAHDRAGRLRELGVPEPESDDTEGYDDDPDGSGDNSGSNHNNDTSHGEAAAAAAGAAAAAVDDDLASWEPGIATRSAKKKRKMELGEFLSSSSSSAPNAKRPATAAAAAAAATAAGEPQPSFLACVYQAVSEKVSSFFFSKNAAATAAATNE
jgi:Helicase associated domain